MEAELMLLYWELYYMDWCGPPATLSVVVAFDPRLIEFVPTDRLLYPNYYCYYYPALRLPYPNMRDRFYDARINLF